jgi:predicted double-glycine peptidase
MGSYFTKGDEMSSYDYSCGSITLGQLITRAHGGDLILI